MCNSRDKQKFIQGGTAMIKKKVLKMAAVCTTMVMMLSGGALMGNGEEVQVEDLVDEILSASEN